MDLAIRKRKGSGATLLLAFGLGAILFSALFFGCTQLEGWGVVIWSVKGTSAKSGTVVPIYLKSNISKSYLIGLPDDDKTKIEVPFTSLEFFSSKRAAEKRAQQFAPYAALYLSARRDGLPVRDKPSVSARRVYRLRLGESVKVLSQAEGEAVFTGGKALPGEWYFVQAADGTRGYVFSNTMVLYEEKEGTTAPVIAQAPTPSASLLDLLYAKPWRPAYYQFMIDDGTIDPDLFILQYGLFADAKNSQVRIELPGYSNAINFSAVSQSGDWLVFEGSRLRIRFENESTIIADWSGADPILAEEGWAQGDHAARFIQLDASIPVMLAGENSRRDAELKIFFSESRNCSRMGNRSPPFFPTLGAFSPSISRVPSNGAIPTSFRQVSLQNPNPTQRGIPSKETSDSGFISAQRFLRRGWEGFRCLWETNPTGRILSIASRMANLSLQEPAQ